MQATCCYGFQKEVVAEHFTRVRIDCDYARDKANPLASV